MLVLAACLVLNLLNKRAALMLENIFIATECRRMEQFTQCCISASLAKNFKMNLCKVNFDRFLTIVE